MTDPLSTAEALPFPDQQSLLAEQSDLTPYLHLVPYAILSEPPTNVVAEGLTEDIGTDPTLNDEQKLMVLSVTGLVHFFTKRFSGQSFQHLDLAQEGFAGACVAAARFDPTRGVKYSDFAIPHIYGAMFRAIRSKDAMIRPLRTDNPRGTNFTLAADRLREQNLPLTTRRLVAESGLTADEVNEERVGRAVRYTSSTDQRRPEDDQTPADRLEDSGPNLYDQVDSALTAAKILDLISDKELQDLVKLKFGLHPYKSPTKQSELARVLGKSDMQLNRMFAKLFSEIRQTDLGVELAKFYRSA